METRKQVGIIFTGIHITSSVYYTEKPITVEVVEMENRAGTSTDFPDSTMPTQQAQGRISLLVLNDHHYLMTTTNQSATL